MRFNLHHCTTPERSVRLFCPGFEIRDGLLSIHDLCYTRGCLGLYYMTNDRSQHSPLLFCY